MAVPALNELKIVNNNADLSRHYQHLRSHPRFKAGLKVVFKRKHGTPMYGTTNNLSEGGMHVTVPGLKELPVGEKVYLVIYLPKVVIDEQNQEVYSFPEETHVTAIAEVRNNEPFLKDSGDTAAGMGLKISVLMSDGKDLLSSFIGIISKSEENLSIITDKEQAETIINDLHDFNVDMSLGALIRKNNDKLIRLVS